MLIKRLTLSNFGIYIGINTFEFSLEKPIVLIGGMNGQGKTTFLDAILLALYGPKSSGYLESKYRSYNRYLIAHINDHARPKAASIDLELLDEADENKIYSIHREWNAKAEETIRVKLNGADDSFLTENWQMFIDGKLPSALSQFFFFDGEKITSLATEETSEEMKKSIRAMLGISVLDVLRDDLKKYRHQIMKSAKTTGNEYTNLVKLKKNLDDAQKRCDNAKKQIAESQEHITNFNKKLEKAKTQYNEMGGTAREHQLELQQTEKDLEEKIKANEAAMGDLAATALPFAMVRNLISSAKVSAEDERYSILMKESYDSIKDLSEEFIDGHNVDGSAIREFMDFMKERNDNDTSESVYNLSEQAIFQLNDLNENGLDNLVEQAETLLKTHKDLNHQLDTVKSHLSLDIDDTKLEKVKKTITNLEEKIDKEKKNLAVLDNERAAASAEFIHLNAEYKLRVEEYSENLESSDNAKRKLDYTNLTMKALDKYEIALQEAKIGKLGETITECYEALANKKNLIDHVVVDPETLNIICKDQNDQDVNKRSLSAGEQQLFVVSILWALAKSSKKKLPVIIDTPLARLDTRHREALVTRYFPYASRQTIILSTDAEIDRRYYGMIRDYIGDTYTLNYDENTKSTSVEKGYFDYEN